MKKIIDLLSSERSLRLIDIARKTNIPIASVQKALADLERIGILRRDPETKLWYLASFFRGKQTFRTKEEYELALKHSQKILDLKDNQHVDLEFLLDGLTICELKLNLRGKEGKMINYPLFLSHLRTGYEDIYKTFKKYVKLVKELIERGIIDSAAISNGRIEIIGEKFGIDYTKLNLKSIELSKKYRTQLTSYPSWFKPSWRKNKEEELKKIIELKEKNKDLILKYKKLRAELIGRFYQIMMDVIHGIPLRGSCPHCPHNKIEIIEKSEGKI